MPSLLSLFLKATLVYLMATMVYSGLFHYHLQCASLLFSISVPILNTLQLILLSFVLREHICVEGTEISVLPDTC